VIGQRWGVTDAELALRYGCDELVPDPAYALWRGVSTAAAPAAVWPWLLMIQRAPYSYDWIDNLGRRSPRVLAPMPEPRPGDRGYFVTVVAVEAGVEVTYRVLSAVMSYRLVEGPQTRLLLKVVMPRGVAATLLHPVLPLGDLVMARKQLLTLAELAEREIREHAEVDETGPTPR
jgi:hypothetical protein